MAATETELSDFARRVASRFGLVPHFFSSAPDAPEVIEHLWGFAEAAYLNNPIPGGVQGADVRRSLALL